MFKASFTIKCVLFANIFFIREQTILVANKIKDKKSMICFMLENNKIRMAHRGHPTVDTWCFQKVELCIIQRILCTFKY